MQKRTDEMQNRSNENEICTDKNEICHNLPYSKIAFAIICHVSVNFHAWIWHLEAGNT